MPYNLAEKSQLMNGIASFNDNSYLFVGHLMHKASELMLGLSSAARTVFRNSDFYSRGFLQPKDSAADSLIHSPIASQCTVAQGFHTWVITAYSAQ